MRVLLALFASVLLLLPVSGGMSFNNDSGRFTSTISLAFAASGSILLICNCAG